MHQGAADGAEDEDRPAGGEHQPRSDALGDLAGDHGRDRGDQEGQSGECERDVLGLVDVFDDEERQVREHRVNAELVDEERGEVAHRRAVAHDRADVLAEGVVLLAGDEVAPLGDTYYGCSE